MYQGDGSAEYQEFWLEMEKARSQYRPSQTMNFYVDPSQGHDDFLMSLALLVEAARQLRPARGERGGAGRSVLIVQGRSPANQKADGKEKHRPNADNQV